MSSPPHLATSIPIPTLIPTPTPTPTPASTSTSESTSESTSTNMRVSCQTPMECSSAVRDLVTVGRPTAAFRQWLLTIIRTTRLTETTVVLALLLIFRLKSVNPHIRGSPGSEYRLLTVALMLGNKCKFRKDGASCFERL